MSYHRVPCRARQTPRQSVPPQWIALACIVASVLPATDAGNIAQADTYYLDARFGNDLNTGTSQRPWKSLKKVQAVARPGDTVLLRNGHYGQFRLDSSHFPLYSGKAAEPLPTTQKWTSYRAAEGQDAVHFSAISFSLGSDLRLVAHAFDGIKITDPDTRCVYAWGVVGLRLTNMTLVGKLDPGVLQSGTHNYTAVEIKQTANDITIEDCEIRGGYRGIHFGGPCCNVRIANCDIYDTGVDKIMFGGGANISIENNKLHGRSLLPSEHPDCIQFYTAANRYEGASATNVTIRGNRLYNHSSQGIWTGGSILRNVIFENNLIYSTGNYEWRVYGVHGGIIRNNTIVGDDVGHTGIIIYGGTFTESDGTLNGYPRNRDITVVNNVFATSYSGAPSVMTYHDHNIYVRPWDGSPGENEPHSYGFDSIEAAVAALFVAGANDDYRLSADSLAIDFGTPQSNPGIDLVGAKRDFTPDAGCYEYTGEVVDNDDWFTRLFDYGTSRDHWVYATNSPPDDEPDEPPYVALVAPAEGDTVAGVVTIQIDATDREDPEGTLQVEVAVALPSASLYRWSPAGYNDSRGYYEFGWDTRSLSDGTQYSIHARASDRAAKTNTAYADPIRVVVQNTPTAERTMRVNSIRARSVFVGAGAYKAAADVVVQNDRGQPVAGASVVGTFRGDITETVTAQTNAVGAARLVTEQSVPHPCNVTFSVDSVVHPDYRYDPGEPTSSSPSAPRWPYW